MVALRNHYHPTTINFILTSAITSQIMKVINLYLDLGLMPCPPYQPRTLRTRRCMGSLPFDYHIRTKRPTLTNYSFNLNNGILRPHTFLRQTQYKYQTMILCMISLYKTDTIRCSWTMRC